MNQHTSLVLMLHQLRKEMDTVTSQGAGYYTCAPFARRFNKLMEKAQLLFPETGDLMDTFEALKEDDPKDPADKSKVLQEIHIEIGQLIVLLESTEKVEAPV